MKFRYKNVAISAANVALVMDSTEPFRECVQETPSAPGEQIELTNESPVIMNILGRRLNPTTLSKWWKDDRKLYRLDGVTFHELRYTYLSMLALNGVHPKVMQEPAGHSDPQTTMQIYTHVNLDAKRSAADVFDHALTA